MSPETLQDLVGRRLEQMGLDRGRDDALSLREAFLAVEQPEISYEIVRRVSKGQHTNIGEGAIRTLAAMLGVDENTVRAAAGQRPTLGRFELPTRANALDSHERGVVLSVIDAILRAGEGTGSVAQPSPQSPRPLKSVPNLSDRRPNVDDLRDEPSAAEPLRRDQGQEGGPNDDGEYP